MNATRVSNRSGRTPGAKLSTLALLPLMCSSCGAQAPSRIYVLSGAHGCKVTAYTMDGKPTKPEIPIGGFGCTGIAIDGTGRILVAIRGPRQGLMRFTAEGKGTQLIASEGASGVALDSSGNIHLLVAKGVESWFVRTFRPDGRPLEGQINIKLNNVSGIALDASGKTFVVSQGNQVVQSFDASGQPLSPAIKTGNTPRAIAVGPDGRIYVANFLSVTAYRPDGKQAQPPLSHRNPETLGIDSPMAIAVDDQGRLYVGYDTGYIGIIDGKSPRPAFMAREDIRGIAVR
jgi:DNA-binding beta-propeller fold protein YncE